MIEKICLLQEEFKKPEDKIRHLRMSRHLYDLHMLCKAGIDRQLTENEEMFVRTVRHRYMYNRIDGVDYNTEQPGGFNIIPPPSQMPLWREDYEKTMVRMINSKDRPTFDEILSSIKTLNDKLNSMKWQERLSFTVPVRPTLGIKP